MIHFCMVCGSLGAQKDESGLYLCSQCSEVDVDVDVDDLKVQAACSELRETSMVFHGPIGCSLCRSTDSYGLMNLCDICSRLFCVDHHIIFGSDDMEISIPESMRKVLPSRLRKVACLCDTCISDILRKMVSVIPERDLPLHINYSGFRSLDPDCSFLDDKVIHLVGERLEGVRRDSLSIKSPSVERVLDISIQYLTHTDYDLLITRHTPQEETRDAVTQGTPSPFVCAPYDHGVFVHLQGQGIRGLDRSSDYKYSAPLIEILKRAFDLGFKHVRFDSCGPFYDDAFKRPQ